MGTVNSLLGGHPWEWPLLPALERCVSHPRVYLQRNKWNSIRTRKTALFTLGRCPTYSTGVHCERVDCTGAGVRSQPRKQTLTQAYSKFKKCASVKSVKLVRDGYKDSLCIISLHFIYMENEIFSYALVAWKNRSHVLKARKLWHKIRCVEFWYNVGK